MVIVNSTGNFSPTVSRGTVATKPTVGQPKFELPTAEQEPEQKTAPAAAPAPSYDVTEEEAEYYREKYGDTYNEDTVCQLYNELAEDGKMDLKYFSYASGYGFAIPVSALKSITYVGFSPDEINHLNSVLDATRNVRWVSDKMFFKEVSRTDENAYKNEWDTFSAGYDREIVTWRDKLRESIDFEMYLKETAKNSTTGKHYPSQEHFDDVIAGLEDTLSVIDKIFGTDDEEGDLS